MTEPQVAQFLGVAAERCHSRGALSLVSGAISLRLQFGRMLVECTLGTLHSSELATGGRYSFVSMKKPTAATHEITRKCPHAIWRDD
jgi:hypothetical protein